MIKKSRLKRFGHVEHKDDSDWVKCRQLKELDKGNARKRPGWIQSRMVWRVQASSKMMRSLGIYSCKFFDHVKNYRKKIRFDEVIMRMKKWFFYTIFPHWVDNDKIMFEIQTTNRS